MIPDIKECPDCGSEELRPDVTCGETDCVNCGWSVSWLDEETRARARALEKSELES